MQVRNRDNYLYKACIFLLQINHSCLIGPNESVSLDFSEQYFLNMYLYINRKIQGLGFTGKWDSPNVCICGNILVLNLKKTRFNIYICSPRLSA